MLSYPAVRRAVGAVSEPRKISVCVPLVCVPLFSQRLFLSELSSCFELCILFDTQVWSKDLLNYIPTAIRHLLLIAENCHGCWLVRGGSRLLVYGRHINVLTAIVPMLSQSAISGKTGDRGKVIFAYRLHHLFPKNGKRAWNLRRYVPSIVALSVLMGTKQLLALLCL